MGQTDEKKNCVNFGGRRIVLTLRHSSAAHPRNVVLYLKLRILHDIVQICSM